MQPFNTANLVDCMKLVTALLAKDQLTSEKDHETGEVRKHLD